jgi:hypothetical protein
MPRFLEVPCPGGVYTTLDRELSKCIASLLTNTTMFNRRTPLIYINVPILYPYEKRTASYKEYTNW